MNVQVYCEAVETKDSRNKLLVPSIWIRENHEPLVSLMDSNFNLIFEPSISKDYNYLIREDILAKIGRISKELYNQNKILIIRSAWRSFEHQKLLWDSKFAYYLKKHPEKSDVEIKERISYFIAPPTKSMHATGGAIDALIYDIKGNCVMDFGTNDGLEIDLSKKCYPYYPEISAEAKKNRALLIGLFEGEDFVCDLKEYWHFDYGNAIWAIEKEKEYAIYGPIPAVG
ncbi:D-alanyl-D-alanine carboxypeptidase family protein [Galbibacter sp. EGI 63066]|uniref:M15 family metallopeptidase n=1 Tax=Galbibacter sp. EGI 63066 TaxID=2993559 RepID=UPI002248F294|nr:M15 family metallopeptidase [Galbibacter sp. EGI 63066]MCX2678907.1 D-alanyl-D-alanine carboxypeptidase family protein [Galbibacter sp. EGI 63066]